jgi:hypothetical protein
MLQVVYHLPATDDLEAMDEFIATFIVGPLRSSPGYRGHTVNEEPLMSPFGRPPWSRIVVGTLERLENIFAIGKSDLIQKNQDKMPEGLQIVFYEFDD